LLRLGHGATELEARNFEPFASIEADLGENGRCEIISFSSPRGDGVIIATSSGAWRIWVNRAEAVSKLDLPKLGTGINGANPNLLIHRLADFNSAAKNVLGEKLLLDGSAIMSADGVSVGAYTVVETAKALVPCLLRMREDVVELVPFQSNTAQTGSAIGFSRSAHGVKPILGRLKAVDPANPTTQLDVSYLDANAARVTVFASR
jgi:hypothetical protein